MGRAPTSSVQGSRLPLDSRGRKQAGSARVLRPPFLFSEGTTLDTVPRNSHLWVPSLCMEKSPENSTLEEVLGQYQRSLRGELLRTSVPKPLGTRA